MPRVIRIVHHSSKQNLYSNYGRFKIHRFIFTLVDLFLQADSSLLRGPEMQITGREGLETSILGLEFRVRPKHFRRGDMKLKCLATIATVYWRSNEESVEGDRPQKVPALESRETVPPGSSRADRVQGE